MSELAGKTLKDPVHGYVPLTPSQIALLDTPEMQRLRYVKQNATTFLTYPAASGSRFEHSLGTLHLARRIIQNALSNADDSVRNQFLADCRAQFESVLRAAGVEPSLTDCDLSELEDFVVECVEFAAMLHDLGTPPFSHTVEELMQNCADDIYVDDGGVVDRWHDYKSETDGAFHEFLALELLREEYGPGENLKARGIETAREAVGAKLPLVERLLRARCEEDSIFGTLKSVICAEIDADRCDYLVRDGRGSGSGFGDIDVDRIVASFTLDRIPSGSDGRYCIEPTHKALSAVESLYVQRYQLYAWQCFHHRVVATNTFLREVLYRLFLCQRNQQQPYAELGISLHHLRDGEGKPRRNGVWDFSDFSVQSALSDAYDITITGLANQDYGQLVESDFLEMAAMLEELLFRKKHGACIWESAAQFTRYNEQLRTPLLTALAGRLTAVTGQSKGIASLEAEYLGGHQVLNWVARNYVGSSFTNLQDLQLRMTNSIRASGVPGTVLLNVTYFKPFDYSRQGSYNLIVAPGAHGSAHELSELVRGLRQVQKRCQFFHAYLLLLDTADEQLTQWLEITRDAIRDVLIEWLPGQFGEELQSEIAAGG